jgi:hypothetical protein
VGELEEAAPEGGDCGVDGCHGVKCTVQALCFGT